MPRPPGAWSMGERARYNEISGKVDVVSGVIIPSKLRPGQWPTQPFSATMGPDPESSCGACNICRKNYTLLGNLWRHFPDCVALNGNPYGVRWDEGIDTTGWDPKGRHVFDPSIEATDSDTLPKRKKPTIEERLAEVNGVVTPSKVAPGGKPIQEEGNPEGNKNLMFKCPICEMWFNAKSKLEKHFLKCVKTNGNPLGLRCDKEWEDKCEEDFIQAFRSRQTILHPNQATATHSTHNSSLEPDLEADDQSAGPNTRQRKGGRRHKRRRVEVSEVPEVEPSSDPHDPVHNPPDPTPDDVWQRAFEARPFSTFGIVSSMPKSQWDAHERFLNDYPMLGARADEHGGLQSNQPASQPQALPRSRSSPPSQNRAVMPPRNPPIYPVYSHNQGQSAYGGNTHAYLTPTPGPIGPTYNYSQSYNAPTPSPYGATGATYNFDQSYNASNPSPYGASGVSLPLHRAPQRHADYYNPPPIPTNFPPGPAHRALIPQPLSNAPHNPVPTYAPINAASYYGPPQTHNIQPIPPQTQTAPDTRHPSHPLSDEDPAIDAQLDHFLGVGWQTFGLNAAPQAPTTGAPALDSSPQTLEHGPGSQFPAIDEVQRSDFPGSSTGNLVNNPPPQNTNTSLFNLDNAFEDRTRSLQPGELPDFDSLWPESLP